MGILTTRQKQTTIVWIFYIVVALAVIGIAWQFWYIALPIVAAIGILTAVLIRRAGGIKQVRTNYRTRR